MENFWDYNVWGTMDLIATLLISLLLGNILKKAVPWLQASLIPTSVIGGMILLAISGIYRLITHETYFNSEFFGYKGLMTLEMITYHSLALGFIASTFTSSKGKMTKQRTIEIFNTGVTTVSTYLLQTIVGLAITLIIAFVTKDFFEAAGMILPFGYGQGTGQAMNYGGIYEREYGFVGGKSFGLAIAALGFLSASIGGVIHLNIQKRRGIIKLSEIKEQALRAEEIQKKNEIPMQESIDKMTIQIALVIFAYLITHILMHCLGRLLPSMKSVIFGFNFLLGVLSTTLITNGFKYFRKKKMLQKEYVNDFLMTRISNFFFDIMVVAGIAAISLDSLKEFWGVLLILGIVGAFATYFYNRLVAKTLFKEYAEEQFLIMYGMLTGTASAGVILLREIDGDFETPASDNMVYQNFPAIVFGFPLMLIAAKAPEQPIGTLLIAIGFFTVMNVILFRSLIFKKRK